MDTGYKKLLFLDTTPDPSHGLFDRIIARVRREECARAVRVCIAVMVPTVCASFVLCFVAVREAVSAVMHSGIIQTAALAFSDSGAVMSEGSDYVFSLLETIPAMSIAGALATCVLFVWSAEFFINSLSLCTSRFSHPRASKLS